LGPSRALIALLLALFGLIAAACSGGSGKPAATASTPVPAAASADIEVVIQGTPHRVQALSLQKLASFDGMTSPAGSALIVATAVLAGGTGLPPSLALSLLLPAATADAFHLDALCASGAASACSLPLTASPRTGSSAAPVYAGVSAPVPQDITLDGAVLVFDQTDTGAVDVPVPPTPGAATTRFVVRGDSYASGEGTFHSSSGESIDYYPSTATAQDRCHRSPAAYGPLLGTAPADFVACSSARVVDVLNGSNSEPSQMDVFQRSPGTITDVVINAGGDDVGFVDVLVNCTDVPIFHSTTLATCSAAVAQARARVAAAAVALRDLYGRILAAAPNAHLLVLGYPRLYPYGGVLSCGFVNPQRQGLLNAAADYIDDRIKAAVAGTPRASFLDIRPMFDGHEACGSTDGPFLNDLQADFGPLQQCPAIYLLDQACMQSYHPNVRGYAAEAALIRGALHL
jgi:hypothetical protein